MTIELYTRVQRCFTVLMENMSTITKRRGREDIYDKAKRILSDPTRVIASDHADAPDFWTGTVVGDTEAYVTFAVSAEMAEKVGLGNRRIGCMCKAGRRGRLCSHALIAEEMRKQGEGEE